MDNDLLKQLLQDQQAFLRAEELTKTALAASIGPPQLPGLLDQHRALQDVFDQQDLAKKVFGTPIGQFQPRDLLEGQQALEEVWDQKRLTEQVFGPIPLQAAQVAQLSSCLDNLSPSVAKPFDLAESIFASASGLKSVSDYLGAYGTGTAAQDFIRSLNAPRAFESESAFALDTKSMEASSDLLRSLSDATRFAASTTDYSRIGELITGRDTAISSIANLTAQLGTDHAALFSSLAATRDFVVSQPPFIYTLPPAGLFTHTGAVRAFTPHEPLSEDEDRETSELRGAIGKETVAFLEVTLEELNPSFLSQYRGAKTVAVRRGADWWTQGSASLRKLIKGVLHSTAPNEIVLPWAKQHNKSLDNNGLPTRATKLDWLCEGIDNSEYRKYLRTELNSAIALIALLDTANHVDTFDEFEEQYDWTVLRIEVAIRHILTLWKRRRGH